MFGGEQGKHGTQRTAIWLERVGCFQQMGCRVLALCPEKGLLVTVHTSQMHWYHPRRRRWPSCWSCHSILDLKAPWPPSCFSLSPWQRPHDCHQLLSLGSAEEKLGPFVFGPAFTLDEMLKPTCTSGWSSPPWISPRRWTCHQCHLGILAYKSWHNFVK